MGDFLFRKRNKHFEQELRQSYEDGEIIVREGDETGHMFVIQEGKVAVIKAVGEEELQLATLEKGNFFGEMSLLQQEARSATVRAIGSVRLQIIRPGGFMLKIRRDPTFAFEMLQRLSSRVRALNDALIALSESGDVSPERLRAIMRETIDAEGGKAGS